MVIRLCSLSEACAAIAARLAPVPTERILLTSALGRICATPIYAVRPSPSFDQSARDGFAVAAQPLRADQDAAVFQCIGEIAAGCTETKMLAAGQALRIMTGAMVPSGCARVLPFEVCQEDGGTLVVPLPELDRKQQHIRRQGQDIQAGQLLVHAGIRLLPDHLLLLAENGCREIIVRRQPSVAVICTGSELVQSGETLRPGQKISSNSTLLTALLHTQGCRCVRSVTVEDKAGAMTALLRAVIEHDQPDLLITTGGMGQSKFDLTEQVFRLLGGELLCNRLRVRPGQAALVGILHGLPFLGLPGPPPAVRLLFHELVAPVLRRLHGEHEPGRLIEAVLADGPLRWKGDAAELVLKGGAAWLDADGQLRARPAGILEPVNAILHLTGHECGRVRVRLVGPLLQGLTL